ncbi:hypothetical protein [Actinomadura sp. 9N215]|uniref:hypothetical protein n=1 Tax=Actinomadura sp. 9N215 TaxID=3375150 RepID=UPI0037A4268B
MSPRLKDRLFDMSIAGAAFLFVFSFIGLLVAVVCVRVIDMVHNDQTRSFNPAWVTAGARPGQATAPGSDNRLVKASSALTYRLSVGRPITSTFTLPRLRDRLLDRVFWQDTIYYFDGYIDFEPTGLCAPGSRVQWRLGETSGRFPFTHEEFIGHIEIPSDTVTLTARLDAPASCGGTLRLIAARVYNWSDPFLFPEVRTEEK